ncbi:MAG TPA: hypothetical protein VGM29_17480 [Polyangiaceae bacterium]|jgi:hypothetical protein
MKRVVILSALLLFTLACGSSGSDSPATVPGPEGGTCTMTGTGSLAITVAGLPAGIAADLVVTDAANAAHPVTASTTLTLPSGTFTSVAGTVSDHDPIVRKAFLSNSTPAAGTICDGQTVTMDLKYTLIPTSNQIWWGNANGASNTLSYASAALAATGGPNPTVEDQTGGTLPGAFLPNGDLWVVNTLTDKIGLERYASTLLPVSGQQTPVAVVTSSALTGGVPGPVSLALDKDGNAWVGVAYSSSVVKFDAGQILASGDVTPGVVISNVPAPNALALDGKGNLWIGSQDNVLEYLVDRLSASTSAAPDVSIDAQTPGPVIGSLTSVLGLAFTANRDLWVNFGGTIALIPDIQLNTGTITPAIQIQADVLALPDGIALDESGGLWMAYSQGKLSKFGASQLTTSSASLAPEVVISSDHIGSATQPALFPAPAGLPLYSSLK